jgi:hypothetical protein
MKMNNQCNGFTKSLLQWDPLRAALKKFSAAPAGLALTYLGRAGKKESDCFSGNNLFNTL